MKLKIPKPHEQWLFPFEDKLYDSLISFDNEDILFKFNNHKYFCDGAYTAIKNMFKNYLLGMKPKDK